MFRSILLIAFVAVLSVATHALGDPIGIVKSWTLRSGVQNFFGDAGQIIVSATVVQSPFVTNQHAQIGSSTADTYLNITIDGDNLVMVVEPEHHCEKTATEEPRCLSIGNVTLAPTTNVQLDLSGSYTYHLGGDPIDFDAEVRVADITANLLGFAVTYNIDSFLDPPDGTLPFNASTLLAAGHRYRLSYSFDSDAAGSLPAIGAVVSGSGSILIEAHPVPEPAALGALAFTGLAIVRKRTGSP